MCMGYQDRPLWRTLNAIAFLLVMLPKYVFKMEPWRSVFEGVGVGCLIVGIWMMFAERRRFRR